MKNQYYLLGKDLSKSKSPEVWDEIFHDNAQKNSVFNCVEITSDEEFTNKIKELFENDATKCIMVTSPYKNIAFDMADFKHKTAISAGCANCLVQLHGRIYAYSSDYFAMIIGHKHDIDGKYYIIGDGSIGKMYKKYLKENGDSHKVIKRNDLHPKLTKDDYVINTSPEDIKDLSYLFDNNNNPKCLIFDLNYKSKYKHPLYTNGLRFLKNQAYAAFVYTQNLKNKQNEII